MDIREKPTLSVIIPIYNVELYLEKCVNSVRKQTLKMLEIILIDDGSTDDSGKICDILASEDNRIIVVHQKNGGLADARNTGLEIARGEWVAFLDSDDWVENSMYEKLINCCVNNKCSISFCDSVDVKEDTISNYIVGKTEEQVIDINDYLRMLVNKNKARMEVWNKVWNRKLVGDTRFVPGQVSEDIHFNRIMLQKIDKIAYLPEALHRYLIRRPGSTATSFKIKRLYAFEEYTNWMFDYYVRQDIQKKSTIAATAANFAIAVYLDSVNNDAPRDVLKLVKSYYDMYIKQVEENGLLSLKHTLFTFSPSVYRNLIMLKGKRA